MVASKWVSTLLFPYRLQHGSDVQAQGPHHVTVYVAQEDAMSVFDPGVPTASTYTGPTYHDYRPLPSVDQATVDEYLRACRVNGQRAYECLYPVCGKKPFKSKDNARVHLHKHLSGPEVKLFECVAW